MPVQSIQDQLSWPAELSKLEWHLKQEGNPMTTTAWILGDQLMAEHPAVEAALEIGGTEDVIVLLIESQSLLEKRRSHRQKFALLISAMRHYADELRQRGLRVELRKADTMLTGLKQHIHEDACSQLVTMAASNWNGRRFQKKLQEKVDIPVLILANQQFLATRTGYQPEVEPKQRLTHENFYRQLRTRLDLLITDDGDPVAGQWNFDEQNREPLPENLTIPEPIGFAPDEITEQVVAEINRLPSAHGSTDGFDLAVSRQQAEQAASYFFEEMLADFGSYEDAMSADSSVLFHSKLSPYLNISLLDPLELAREAERRYHKGQAPINSVEGFIRQVVGWREYMYWQYWRTMPESIDKNFFQAERQLPDFFWSGETEMNCLKHTINRASERGYTHHIERLMVLSNFCLLTGIEPKQVYEWFMANYIDAYEWVMVPNVMGMGLFADGGLTSTKPYAASANYINKMSNYCDGCRYYRSKRLGENACPFNSLYWNFMLEHENILRQNPWMNTSLLGLRHFDEEERSKIRSQALEFMDRLHGEQP